MVVAAAAPFKEVQPSAVLRDDDDDGRGRNALAAPMQRKRTKTMERNMMIVAATMV